MRHALTERGKCDEQGGKQSLGKAKTVARYIRMQESSTDCLFFVRPKRAVVIDSTLLLKLQRWGHVTERGWPKNLTTVKDSRTIIGTQYSGNTPGNSGSVYPRCIMGFPAAVVLSTELEHCTAHTDTPHSSSECQSVHSGLCWHRMVWCTYKPSNHSDT